MMIECFEIKMVLLIGGRLWEKGDAANHKSKTNNLVGKNRRSYKSVGTGKNLLGRKRKVSPNSELVSIQSPFICGSFPSCRT
jgi:hypothetical protein